MVLVVKKFVFSVGNEMEEINLYCWVFCLWGWLIYCELILMFCKFENDLYFVVSFNLWFSNCKCLLNSSDYVMFCIKMKVVGIRI